MKQFTLNKVSKLGDYDEEPSIKDLERLSKKFSILSGGCWRWTTKDVRNGYGRFYFKGIRTNAHRVLRHLIYRDVLRNNVVDHLCRNTLCVNPKHLEPVTQLENVRRGNGVAAINRAKLTCKNGHLLSGSNLKPRKDGYRECQTCHREASAKYYRRKSENLYA